MINVMLSTPLLWKDPHPTVNLSLPKKIVCQILIDQTIHYLRLRLGLCVAYPKCLKSYNIFRFDKIIAPTIPK